MGNAEDDTCTGSSCVSDSKSGIFNEILQLDWMKSRFDVRFEPRCIPRLKFLVHSSIVMSEAEVDPFRKLADRLRKKGGLQFRSAVLDDER